MLPLWRIVTKNSNNRWNCVFSVYIYILHAIRHQSAMKRSSFSKTFFFVVVVFLRFASRVAFFLRHFYLFICDHSFGHASRITQIAHFLSIIFEFVWFTFRIKQITWQIWNKKRSTIVSLCMRMHIVCLLESKMNEWMNAKQITRPRGNDWIHWNANKNANYKQKLQMTHGFMVDTLAAVTDFFLYHNKYEYIITSLSVWFGLNSIKLSNIIYINISYTFNQHTQTHLIWSVNCIFEYWITWLLVYE